MPLKLISASSDMHCEVFKKVGTNFWHGAVGVDHEEHVQALKNRNERHKEASRKKKSKKENMEQPGSNTAQKLQRCDLLALKKWLAED